MIFREEVFNVKKESGDWWKVKKNYTAYFRETIQGYIYKKNILILPKNADFIDIFILNIQKNGFKDDNFNNIKITSKFITYIKKLLRKNQKEIDKTITIKLTKSNLILLKKLKDMLDIYAVALSADLFYAMDISNAQQLLVYTKSVIDIDRLLGKKISEDCYHHLTNAYDFLEDKPKSLFYNKKLLEIYSKEDRKSVPDNIFEKIIKIYDYLGNTNGVVKYSRKYIDYLNNNIVIKNNISTYSFVYGNLIKILLSQSRYNEALNYAKEFNQFYLTNKKIIKSESEDFEYETLYSLANVYNKKAQFKEAFSILDKIDSLYKENNSTKTDYIKLYINYAKVYSHNKEYIETIRYNIMAVSLYQSKPNLFELLEIYNNIIDATYMIHSKEEANKLFTQTLSQIDSLIMNENRSQVYLFELTGDLFFKIQNYKKAKFYYNLAKENTKDNAEGRAEFSPILIKLASVYSIKYIR